MLLYTDALLSELFEVIIKNPSVNQYSSHLAKITDFVCNVRFVFGQSNIDEKRRNNCPAKGH